MLPLFAAAALVRISAGQVPASAPALSIEAEVLENIRGQRIGRHHVRDLQLPDAFLGRVADRIIRSSFEAKNRLIIPDSAPADAGPMTGAANSAPAAGASSGDPQVVLKAGGLAAAFLAGLCWLALRRRRRR
jgi:hypothetical protein